MSQLFVKDADALLDFTLDWSTWLDGDTISAKFVAVGADESEDVLEINSYFESGGKVTAWVESGMPGQTYRLWNRIATAGGRRNARRMLIRVRER